MQIQDLVEGRYDPHVFKAVFMAGSPGAGKSTVANKLFRGSGLRVVDVDKFYSMYQTKEKDIDYDRFHDLAGKQISNYLDGRMGLLLDGTAKDLTKTTDMAEKLKEMGYDISMIFVNTDLDVAMDRVQTRFQEQGRYVSPDVVKQTWEAARNNLGALQSIFGNRFYIIDNTHDMDISYVEKQMRNFLNSPPRNSIAREWLNHKPE